RQDARRLVDGEAADVAGDDLDLAGMNRRPNLEAEVDERVDHLQRGDDRTGSSVEDREEAITGGVHLDAAMAFENLSHPPVVPLEELVTGRITDPGRQLGGRSDIGEEHGREDALADRLLAPPAPAAPDDRHRRLLPEHPLIVARWDLEHVA